MLSKISPGTRLGPYEIQSLLGAGGMGEVYRARDSRLQRDVAIKVLPGAFADDHDRLRRFELEARAAGQLNHPNIMAVHDVGSSGPDGGGLAYIVCELLDGVSLRDRLASGPIPPRKAVNYAIQIAKGLAAAHAKGVAHRDLKPENLMIVSGDHLKILDFGIAKLLHAERTGIDDTGPLASTLTVTGAILGTPSYMSPEQIRDHPTDHRTDIFTLGAILYEMLTGRRAFDGPSHADRMTAILTSEPPQLANEIEDAAPGVGAIITHCLEKSPGERFDSAGDLAFALSLVVGRSDARAPGALPLTTEGRAGVPGRDLVYRRITFREGAIFGALFSPDGNAICYGAAWDDRPVELFWAYPGNPESRALGFPQTDLMSIAPTGEMAILLRRQSRGGFQSTGMLARAPIGGGAPREIMDGVSGAEFHPDGRRLAIKRDQGGMTRIEFPAGTVLYQTPGWVGPMRFSRDGSRIAFEDHPARGNDAGSVGVVDLRGNVKRLSAVWATLRGAAWSPDGREVVFAASKGEGRALHAVDLVGVERTVLRAPGNMTLKDISPRGDTLLAIENDRMRTYFVGSAEPDTRELTWLDWTLLRGITADGSRILFDETGAGGGESAATYIRGTDGSPAIRLGDGLAYNLSPDGEWALTGSGRGLTHLDLVPCGAGEPRTIPTGNLEVNHASWFPDGRSICCLAKEPGRGMRLYKIDLANGTREPFTEEGISYYDSLVSPDGRFAVAHGPDRKLTIYPVDGGAGRPVTGVIEFERTVGWSADGKAILIFSRGEIPAKVWRIDLETGERTLDREISPRDATGVQGLAVVRMAADGKALAYSYYQFMSRMYVVEGLFA
jgi:Tol biopolymer transport system component